MIDAKEAREITNASLQDAMTFNSVMAIIEERIKNAAKAGNSMLEYPFANRGCPPIPNCLTRYTVDSLKDELLRRGFCIPPDRNAISW